MDPILQFNSRNSLSSVLRLASSIIGFRPEKLLKILSWQASIYIIQLERNHRLHS
ncbi:unnamed protein product [Arabidopsis halleri]